MAKFLTLNTHSLLGEDIEGKMKALGDEILRGDYDAVCLQEINQLETTEDAAELPGYCPVEGEISIHEDNYGLNLVRYLAENGATYYWSYAYNHIGYDRFNEGVMILSKNPIEASEVTVSDCTDQTDYHTRKMVIGKTLVDGRKTVVASGHFSWLKDGFLREWENAAAALSAAGDSIVVMGDFNNPANTEGYNAVMSGPLGLRDTYADASVKKGENTIKADIDGWEGNKDALRIDFIFATSDFAAKESEVVFDGTRTPVISDHFGVSCVAETR